MDLKPHFKLIAAQAELMEAKANNVWSSDLHKFVRTVRESLDQIEQEGRRRDSGDR